MRVCGSGSQNFDPKSPLAQILANQQPRYKSPLEQILARHGKKLA